MLPVTELIVNTLELGPVRLNKMAPLSPISASDAVIVITNVPTVLSSAMVTLSIKSTNCGSSSLISPTTI